MSNSIGESLAVIANSTGRSVESVLTQHLLEAVLRRVSQSVYAEQLVLRGSLLTRYWVAPAIRVAMDVDFVGLYPFSIDSTAERFYEALTKIPVQDGVIFDLDSFQAKGIWLETDFPGARINLDALMGEYRHNIQIDVGFGDPLVPPALWLDYPTLLQGELVRVQACRPETLVGWKLHGLVELGAKRWRPKDLYDLMLFATQALLNEAVLPQAISVAFSSRATPLREVLDILSQPQWWDKQRHHNKWMRYVKSQLEQEVPDDLLTVVAAIGNRWLGILEILAK